ncbi:maleylacetoacetate isomerase [Sphingomonas sp. SM33]|uniref:Maleylacetoacetate isomerase n=1 Tax=Sphingomonas telluris TaxID=2907998 RepID=A0ABS9VRB5_9SPHN|nr:maleylacetoacetate isomerase [Sphingomonas telluris]MCH8617109.1 maleylacetoacetate isomerase [Sphingomonas telluris]
MPDVVLYDYFRSSAAYRVRIALNLKNVQYESRPINLAEGAQKSDEYKKLNPQSFVPMLEIDGHRFVQSLAIINYLDLRFPTPPLIPTPAVDRAHVVAMAMMVACDIHPLNNLRVLKYLKNELGHSKQEADAWYAHWISEGLPALEAFAAPRAGKFLFGDAPTAADVLLVPQLFNARRFNVPLDDYPTLLRADENASKLEPFASAHPDRQEQPK